MRTDEWETPAELFQQISDRWGPFDLDAAATAANAKAPKFFTKEDDGLAQVWGGNVYVNPPYGRNETGLWVAKALRSSEEEQAKSVTMLLPASTSTKWFHGYILERATIVLFIKRRVNFIRPDGISGPAPFSSMVVHYQGRNPLQITYVGGLM